jgi:peptidoglycan/xylan/chitin deacetylase (PgdA/CDA1 family)
MTKRRRLVRKVFYDIKPAIPRKLQIILRRLIVQKAKTIYRDIWPIHERAGIQPNGWKGWQNNKKFALVLTHDVDTWKGEDNCLELMKIDREAGFKSAFYFVPGRAKKSAMIIPELKKNGFEVGVHGLFHDGKLFMSRKKFLERAKLINKFLLKWGAVGFRAECMHHDLDWIHDLNILYDASTFDVDPFEPQPDGVETIFPFLVKHRLAEKRYVELPYTLPQDFTLFVIMRQKNIDIWEKKLDWIASKGGMALVITHPDYINFGRNRLAAEEYPVDIYSKFLAHIKQKYSGLYWNALPSEIARYLIMSQSS